MAAGTMRAGRPVPWRRVMLAMLISLTAGLGLLAAGPQAAFAAPQGASSISAGYDHSCAIKSGKAYCWGYNNYGQLGDGSTALFSRVPVAVDASGALAGKILTQVTAGDESSCALDSTGAAYCWGDNNAGELGDGSTVSSSVPVAVDASGVLAGQTLTRITAADDTCALDVTGAAYCWGEGSRGQLGDGSTVSSSVPVAVDASGVLAGTTLTEITANDLSTCALDVTGAAYCWGEGALGDGSFGESSVPVAVDASGVLAGKTLTQITAGVENACVLDSTGAAYCWGQGAALGDGSIDESSVPVAVDTSGVLAGKTLTQITADGVAACALDSTGAAYCWGYNDFGYLGDDSTAARSLVPVLVGPQAPTGVTAVPGAAAATVSWTAPAWLNTGNVTGYTATASPGGAACTTAGATTCTITGLASGTYSITVAVRATTGDSGNSTPGTVTLPPVTGPIISGFRSAKCVNDSGDSSANDTKIVIGDCDGSAGQNWTVEADGTIQVNGRCMDIYRDEKTSKAPVELWTCTGGANQKWQPRNGTLVNPVSGRCLDDPAFSTADGTQLEIYTCNGGRNQQWELP